MAWTVFFWTVFFFFETVNLPDLSMLSFNAPPVIGIAFSTGGVILARFPPPSVELGGPPKLS